jgi:hypothetical protein
MGHNNGTSFFVLIPKDERHGIKQALQVFAVLQYFDLFDIISCWGTTGASPTKSDTREPLLYKVWDVLFLPTPSAVKGTM